MFDYTVESRSGMEETIEKLKTTLMEEKFGTLWEFDIQAKLQEKGLELTNLTKFWKCVIPMKPKEC